MLARNNIFDYVEIKLILLLGIELLEERQVTGSENCPKPYFWAFCYLVGSNFGLFWDVKKAEKLRKMIWLVYVSEVNKTRW